MPRRLTLSNWPNNRNQLLSTQPDATENDQRWSHFGHMRYASAPGPTVLDQPTLWVKAPRSSGTREREPFDQNPSVSISDGSSQARASGSPGGGTSRRRMRSRRGPTCSRSTPARYASERACSRSARVRASQASRRSPAADRQPSRRLRHPADRSCAEEKPHPLLAMGVRLHRMDVLLRAAHPGCSASARSGVTATASSAKLPPASAHVAGPPGNTDAVTGRRVAAPSR